MKELCEKLAEQYAEDKSNAYYIDQNGDQKWYMTERGRYSKEDFLAGYQAAKPQWISVKERLPEIAPNRFVSDDVLWISRYGELHVSCLEQLRHEIRVDWGEAGSLKLDQVTHWMPLPKPPEDK